MKIRFWQKIYILALTLFLLCLYAGFVTMLVYNYDKSVSDAKDTCKAEYNYIASSFERDYRTMADAGNGLGPELLMESYAAHYKVNKIYLSFSDIMTDGSHDRTEQYGSPEFADASLDIADSVSIRSIDGVKYVCIQSRVCDKYYMTYLRDVSVLDEDYASMLVSYVIAATVVSLILAVVLLLVLKRLSVPIERLRATTEVIAAGDLSVTADAGGKDEFAELAASFNIMVDKIKSQMQELSDDAYRKQMLVDNMAHEMRTPLTSIRGYAEYAEKAAVPDEERFDALMRITAEADRLQKISEKILDTAYIREHGVEKLPVDMAFIVKDTVDRLSFRADDRGVKLELDASDCTVIGDKTLLMMLIYNLTENAIKATSEGGTVSLVCGGNTVTVTDTGKGMTAEQLSHIMQPFYRTDKSRSRAEGGAGLGLALCKQIVDSHGAAIAFSSEVGKGTAVTLTF